MKDVAKTFSGKKNDGAANFFREKNKGTKAFLRAKDVFEDFTTVHVPGILRSFSTT